jgi:hypothetical protein
MTVHRIIENKAKLYENNVEELDRAMEQAENDCMEYDHYFLQFPIRHHPFRFLHNHSVLDQLLAWGISSPIVKCNQQDTNSQEPLVFTNSVETCAQEAVYLTLQIPLTKATRKVVFINTSPPNTHTLL